MQATPMTFRQKFPTSAAEEALMNDQAYIDELNAACEQKVLEAVNGAGH